VPALVATCGLAIGLFGLSSLRAGALASARDHIAEQSRIVTAPIDDALAHADRLLERMRPIAIAHSADAPFDDVALALQDIAVSRPGVTYASLSFPDGTFQGAYRDTDGTWRFEDSRVASDGTHVRRYDFAGRRLVLRVEETSTYDPRSRAFYRDALAAEAPTWTAPYTFFGSRATGLTRAEAVTIDGALHAVMTIDFDVHALSSTLRERTERGTRALLFASDGSVLAHSDAAALDAAAVTEDRIEHVEDLHDPVLEAYYELLPGAGVSVVDVGGARWLAATTPMRERLGLGWAMVYLAPEARFLGVLHDYVVRFVWIEIGAIAAAVIVAWMFARHVARVRREADAAKADAANARKDALELGSYRLLDRLGAGGMGEVWRAEHRLLAREAAIKRITPPEEGEVTDELKTRFRREAEALAQLRSRHTIELFDFGISEEGTFFFVMELLDGVDLETLVTKFGPISPGRALHFTIAALRSLTEAHARGLVHRDVKPANLFTCRVADEVDVLKVLDFGLVRSVKRSDPITKDPALDAEAAAMLVSATTTIGEGSLGTPAFMPPEQAAGEPVDGRADLYALAGTVYWMLTGKLLYEKNSAFALILAHIQEPLPNLRETLPRATPPVLIDVLERCLAKSRDERPASAREVLDLLLAIELPESERWTIARAQAWWREHLPEREHARPLSVRAVSA